MDEAALLESLGEELIRDWDVSATGSGYLVISDWHWPNNDRIEIFVRAVGDRDDLFIVSDGGDLFNFLFSNGVDLTKDDRSMKLFKSVARGHGADFVDYQIVKGANAGDLARAIRVIVEVVKDVSLLMWHKFSEEQEGEPS